MLSPIYVTLINVCFQKRDDWEYEASDAKDLIVLPILSGLIEPDCWVMGYMGTIVICKDSVEDHH